MGPTLEKGASLVKAAESMPRCLAPYCKVRYAS